MDGFTTVPHHLGEIDLRFQQAWLPFFSRASSGHADVDECLRDFGDWSTLEEISLPFLTGEIMFDSVHAHSPSAGGIDGWGMNDFRTLSVGLV